MTAFAERVAAATGTTPDSLERLAGGDLSQVLLARRADGRAIVAKPAPVAGAEAAMLRAIAAAGVPAPTVEGEYDGILLIEHVANDRVFSPAAWADVGAALRRLHAVRGDDYGWPVDYRLGTVEIDNRPAADWPTFWAERRLAPVASVLDLPWRERIAKASARMADLLPPAPAAALLHGDLWGGNILVDGGRLAALIDPASYFGDAEVDVAMLEMFDSPPPEFHDAYGPRAAGWEKRLPAYQLFPALVHLRLFGAAYEPMVDRLLGQLGG